MDTKSSQVTNDPDGKLSKLESLRLNNLNGLTYQDAKNKNMK